MVAPSGDSNEQVRYDILIEAKQAITALRDMLKYTHDNTVKMAKFTNQVILDSKRWGMSWKQALDIYKQLNKELAKSKKGTLFGQTGGQDLFKQSEQYMQSMETAGRMAEMMAQKTSQVGESATRMGSAGQSATSKFALGLHLVRIALGALASMLLFNVIQAIQQTFATAIKNAKEFEMSLYRLHNAERILSSQGIDISMQGLEDGIKRIKKLLPVFSKEDISGLVGQVAITTKELGLSEKQILDLSQAIGVLNINSVDNETIQQTAQKVMSSLLTDNAKGVANLGIQLGHSAIEAKALELGILGVGESFDDLSKSEKDMAKVAIVIDTAQDSVAGLNEYLDSNTGRLEQNKAAWNDLLTTVGQVLLPFLPMITKFFQFLNDGFNFLKVGIITVAALLYSFIGVWISFTQGGIKSFKDLTNALHYFGEEVKKTLANKFFPDGLPENAPGWVKEFLGGSISQHPDTATGVGSSLGDDEQNADEIKKQEKFQDDLQDTLQDSADKKLDIERDYQRKLADIATDYQHKLEDIARETAQKREDALRDYNQKVEDINRDTNEKIAEAQQEARQKELDKESEFQNKLRELRDKFLFDLEDALHERDARQVLRLIRQYNLDKKNLEERHKLERQDTQNDLAKKIADLERERQLKLEAAKREYDEKLQEIQIQEARARQEANIWKQRQLQDARIWHQRQLQEQREYLQRRLRDLAEAIAQEYQMTAAGAQALYSLLNGYTALGGTQLPNLSTALGGSSTTSSSYGGAYTNQQAGIGSGLYNPYDIRARSGMGFAEGGTLLATRPTTATFGENGPERIDITPLGKVGNNVGKMFGDKSAMGMDGSIRIALDLSPDLEARIVENSMDNVALILERINRSR